MADTVQAYLRSLEEDYERPQLVRNLMPTPGSALGVAVTLAAGQTNPATAGPINFTVTFTRPVVGFVSADISLVGSTAPGTLAAAVTGTGPAYNVAVTGMTGNGLVAVSVIPGAATDAVTGVLTPGSIAAVVQATTDVTAPSVVMALAPGQASPASGTVINFQATFSEPVLGFNDQSPAGMTPVGTTAPGNYRSRITGGPTVYNIAMSGMTGGPGNVGLMVNQGACTDYAGNPNTPSNSVVVPYTGL